MQKFKLFLGVTGVLVLLDWYIQKTYPGFVNQDQHPLLLPLPLSWFLAFLILGFLAFQRNAWTPLALMSAGFLANIIAYMAYGKFIDFIPFHFWYSSLSDLVIVVGCMCLLVFEYKKTAA